MFSEVSIYSTFLNSISSQLFMVYFTFKQYITQKQNKAYHSKFKFFKNYFSRVHLLKSKSDIKANPIKANKSKAQAIFGHECITPVFYYLLNSHYIL